MSSKINIPAKVIAVQVTSKTGLDTWPYDDGSGDPYWNGGSSPKSYRWEIAIDITVKNHGSHLTREPYEYNGLDVNVGDWIAGATTGTAAKIIEISSKTETNVTCIVEDVLRYNTFRSSLGVGGIFPIPGPAVIFELNEEGYPVIDPLPVAVASADFAPNLSSRFNNFNLQYNYVLEKTAHTFEVGDVISMNKTTNEYDFASSTNTSVVGTVVETGPGPNQFLVRPTTKIVDFVPALPGEPGDTIYVNTDGSGDLTLTNTGRPMFLKLTDATPSEVTGTVADATTTTGNVLKINGVDVSIGGTGTITDAISSIDAKTNEHSVDASTAAAPTTAQTSLSLSYGLIGAFTDAPGPAQASINGTIVTFSTNTAGVAQYAMNVAIQEDMANDINAAGIPDIVASYDSSNLYITNTAGGAITIVNITNDTNGVPWAGPSSSTGIPLSTSASTQSFLKLTRADGGPIILQNGTGTPIEDFGLVSVENGKLPLALQLEEGIRKGDMFVVADIAARDTTLSPLIGDQAMVLDSGNSEWALYLWDGSQWVLISDEDAANTDANSLTITITPSSSATELIGTLSDSSRVSLISVEVTLPFDGTPTLNIGDSDVNDRLMSDNLLDLSTLDTYTTQSDHFYNTGNDVDINAYFSAGGSTTGEAKIVISYL